MRRNPDGKSEEEWYAEMEHYPYPDDLPIPRRMKYGPHTEEVAKRFLDADYPLPGTFPNVSRRRTSIPAWIEYLEQDILYPGSKLGKNSAAARSALVHDFAASGFSDPNIAREIFEIDRKTGFNPLFEFQYAVVNFPKFSQILIFELNGVDYILHWDQRTGWNINKQPIDEDPIVAKDNFALFELVGSSLDNQDQYYPIVRVRGRFSGDPNKILSEISGPPTPNFLMRIGLRQQNPSGLEDTLAILEEEYFDNPPFIRKRDLKKINELRNQLGLPLVDAKLNELVPEELEEGELEEEIIEEPVYEDPYAQAREIYQKYLDKEAMMAPHKKYAKRLLRATASVQGRTPVKPLATMGTGGGPLLCDYCHKQIPLESGKYHGVGAGTAWRREKSPKDNWVSYILNHVTFMQESNGTFRVYHGYENRGCGGKAIAADDKKMKQFNANKPSVPSGLSRNLRDFFLDEHGMSPEESATLARRVISELFSYDPGIGVNRP